LIEQLLLGRPLLKAVVEYKRSGKQLRRVESIMKAIRRGRVHPLFSQTHERDGRISSTDPDLFADGGLEQLRECVCGEAAMWFHDRRKSIEWAQQASGDLALKNDLTGPKQVNLFMNGEPIMSGLDPDELLLMVLIGKSAHHLSAHFLVDQITSTSIIVSLEARYQKLFRYFADVKAQALKRGYVEREGVRRYFEGLRSASIEKQNKAQVFACRWLLRY
jgi:hypothetical protein